MDKKGALIILGLLLVQGIRKEDDNALTNTDVLDAMAYTENLIEPGQIKTEAYKETNEAKIPKKKVNLADLQLNEDQAIAAYAEGVESKADDLPAAPAPKQEPKKVEPKVEKPIESKKEKKQEDDDGVSDVDVSSITPDHKNTEPLKIVD